MAIRNASMRNALATAYAAQATHGGLATADPGTTDSISTEVTGGSPAYARKALSWGAAASSAVTATQVLFDVPSGTTVTYFFVANGLTGNNVRDSVAVTSQNFSSQGQYGVTPTYTQS